MSDHPEPTLPPLERECPRCKGAGRWRDKDNVYSTAYDRCPECEGAGVVLTEAGDGIMGVVRRYLRIQAKIDG